MFRLELDSERAVLNEEKLTLAAEILRRPSNIIERADRIDQAAAPLDSDDNWLGPENPPFEDEEPRRSRWWLAIVPILLMAPAAGAYFASSLDGAALHAQVMGALG